MLSSVIVFERGLDLQESIEPGLMESNKIGRTANRI